MFTIGSQNNEIENSVSLLTYCSGVFACSFTLCFSATVFVGEWNKSSDPDQQGHLTAPPRLEIEVEEIIRHPDFVEDPSINISSQNDIALFRLKHPLAFNGKYHVPEMFFLRMLTLCGESIITFTR